MKVIIIGLGLIGGSIAKQLIKNTALQVFAYDSNTISLKSALNNSSIHGKLYNLDELNSTEYENSLIIKCLILKLSLKN